MSHLRAPAKCPYFRSALGAFNLRDDGYDIARKTLELLVISHSMNFSATFLDITHFQMCKSTSETCLRAVLCENIFYSNSYISY